MALASSVPVSRRFDRVSLRRLLAGSSLLCLTAPALAQQAGPNPPPPPVDTSQPAQLPEVTVTASRRDLLGTASTASEGVVDDQEIQLTPAYRPGQVLETVPGLTATVHSGEGKANQYLMRGYNLDHGTDLETYVDGMPINQPTHAHGQGYTDLNFMMPELANQISYTKGPYYANVGDFGAVGSARIDYRDTIENQATVGVGTLGYERVFTAGSQPVGAGQFLGAAEFQHYDGPFVVPDDERKENLVLRYSEGGQAEGFSITGMFYHNDWTNTTDIPLRAITDGAVPNRFGSLDPSDGGNALRASLSGNYHGELGPGQLAASAFYIYNQLDLFNDFTHFLVDPMHGDQEDQFETRNVVGGGASYTLPATVAGLDNEFLLGTSIRYDTLNVGRLPSQGQVALTPLQTASDPASFSNNDDVNLFAGALYLQTTTHWMPTVRTVLGLREDYQYGTDHDLLAALHETAGYTNGGTRAQSLPQPKGSVIYAPRPDLEFYLSGGEGFHSADLRGVNQDRYAALGLPGTSLLARQWGEEIGVRANVRKDLALTFAVYNLWQQSETIIDPDVGMDSAGPPSERYGFEVNATYQIRQWLELYGSFSGNHARFTRPFDDGTGHVGEYITDAPAMAGSLALYLHDLGPWSGGLAYRYLGDYPLSSGPCMNAAAVHDFPGVATSCANAPTTPGQVNGKGYGQLNLDVHYAIAPTWRASFGIYNLLNTHAAAAEFWYVDRLQSEIAAYPQGRADVHQHPLEPLMARIGLTMLF
ncbi:MAG TPA: TonB-dependent receptor [Candidatus Sulfotelmatobacter sp.]|nr:TonB-dependent receptor [Candidatus Sulfotelmatobacter sp.]